MKRTVLIIEDTPDIAQLVRMHLEDLDCEVLVENRGDTGLARFREGGIDLVILDLMLPGLDGLSVCREIRTLPGYTPVLMLTARSSELDRVLGLEMGADDYLTKPFSVAELTARVKALFRRVDALSQPSEKPDNKILTFDQLRIDPAKRRVWIADAEVEVNLLLNFATRPGVKPIEDAGCRLGLQP